MIRCPQCGYANPIGHIFCVQCRSKLNIQTVDTEAWAEQEPEPKTRRGWRLVWLVMGVGLILGAALALWPVPLEGHRGTEADSRQARQKILWLEKGLSPSSQVFTEREINAYLAMILHNVPPPRTMGIWTTVLQATEVAIHPNAMTFSTASVWGPVMVGSHTLGPWPVTSQVTVVPEQDPRGVQWTIKNGRIGHLPLPGPASAWAVVMLRPLLASSFRERALIMAVSRVELEEGRIVVAVKVKVRSNP